VEFIGELPPLEVRLFCGLSAFADHGLRGVACVSRHSVDNKKRETPASAALAHASPWFRSADSPSFRAHTSADTNGCANDIRLGSKQFGSKQFEI
jgi:hypothetical protein